MKTVSTSMSIVLMVSLLAFGTIHEVPTQYSTIQSAIDATNPSDTVLVLPGVYQEYLVIDNHAITLGSRTVLDQDAIWRDSTILLGFNNALDALVTIQGPFGDTMRLEGLTIRDHRRVGSAVGGGLRADSILFHFRHNRFVADSCSLAGGGACRDSRGIFFSNLVDSNSARDYHGGFLFNGPGSLILKENVVIENSSHPGLQGGITAGNDTLFASGNRFERNHGNQIIAGLAVSGSFAMIRNNMFIENIAANSSALAILRADSCLIDGNHFVRNIATFGNQFGFGPALFLGHSLERFHVSNNLFHENIGTYGATVFVQTDGTFENNRFIRNRGYWSSGIEAWATMSYSPNVMIRNNLFLENGPTEEGIGNYLSVNLAMEDCSLFVAENDFIDNAGFAGGWLHVMPAFFEMDNNYWGHPDGPFHQDERPEGLGDTCVYTRPTPIFSSTPFRNYGFELHPWILEAGDTAIGDTSEAQIHVVNTDAHEVLIISLSVDSSSFSLVTQPPLIIPPRDSVVVSLLFHPLAARDHIATFEASHVDTLRPPLRTLLQGRGLENRIEEEPQRSSCDTSLPDVFGFHSPAPNPFNPTVQLRVDLPTPAPLQVFVYDLHGREVERMARNSAYAAGRHVFTFDGSSLASGVYFARAVVPGEIDQVHRLLLIK